MTASDPGPRLVVTSGAGLARQIPISFRGIVLGRDARLGPPFSTDEFVSRSHVWVRRRGDGVEVTDLGSANGTYVNGTRVRAPTLMQHSDVLRIGQIHLKLAAPGEPDRPVASTIAAPTRPPRNWPNSHRERSRNSWSCITNFTLDRRKK